MAAVRAEPAQVSRCWHHEPVGELLEAKNGSMIAVHVGVPAYQLTDGTVVIL